MDIHIVTPEVRAESEYYQGGELGQEKSKQFLKKISMPLGLLPLKDIEECGHHRETGLVWLKQKKKIIHKFPKIGRLVSYAPVITAVFEPHRITKLTGVEAKEVNFWLNMVEIKFDNPPTKDDPGEIVFKSPGDHTWKYPSAAFEPEETPIKDAKKV